MTASTVPLAASHIYAAIGFEFYTFSFQQRPLFYPTWSRSSGMVDNTMTRVAAINPRHAQDFPDQPGVFIASNQPGNLAVGSHDARGDFLHYG